MPSSDFGVLETVVALATLAQVIKQHNMAVTVNSELHGIAKAPKCPVLAIQFCTVHLINLSHFSRCTNPARPHFKIMNKPIRHLSDYLRLNR